MNQEEIKQIIHEFPDRAIRWLLETPDNVKGLLLTTVAADLAKHIDYTRLQPNIISGTKHLIGG